MIKMAFKLIDGNYLEGGGQILRISTALSSLLNIPVEITNIRAGRPRPGLAPQHLHGLLLARDITDGQLIGAEIGSTRVQFIPKKISGGNYSVDTRTAGSITLILQSVWPMLIFAEQSSFVRLRGGTHVPFAPFLDFFTQILPFYLPFLRTTEINCEQFGFYPKGGGRVTCHIEPISTEETLPPIIHTEFGELTSINGFILISGRLQQNLQHKNTLTARQTIQRYFSSQNPPMPSLRIDWCDEPYSSDGLAMMLWANTTKNCRISSSILASRDQFRSDCWGNQVAEDLIKQIKNCPAVDEHLQDQLIIYMALASGNSQILTGEVTTHTKTAIWVTEQFTGVKFQIKPMDNGLNLIECQGIGYCMKNFYPSN